jgi:hypothetical protein
MPLPDGYGPTILDQTRGPQPRITDVQWGDPTMQNTPGGSPSVVGPQNYSIGTGNYGGYLVPGAPPPTQIAAAPPPSAALPVGNQLGDLFPQLNSAQVNAGQGPRVQGLFNIGQGVVTGAPASAFAPVGVPA